MSAARFSDLVGKTINVIEGLQEGGEIVLFKCSDGTSYRMWHLQDCCEHVSVDDVIGDVSDLIGSPVLIADEVTSCANPDGVANEYQESFTWTFYEIATQKGWVTIRWYGSSNGYYSERVYFEVQGTADSSSGSHHEI